MVKRAISQSEDKAPPGYQPINGRDGISTVRTTARTLATFCCAFDISVDFCFSIILAKCENAFMTLRFGITQLTSAEKFAGSYEKNIDRFDFRQKIR